MRSEDGVLVGGAGRRFEVQGCVWTGLVGRGGACTEGRAAGTSCGLRAVMLPAVQSLWRSGLERAWGRAGSGLDGDRGAHGDVFEEVSGHVFGHADAAVAGRVAWEEACVHADAVVGEAHEVGHFGAFEFEAWGWAVGAVVDIAVDDIAVLVDEGAVAAGFVAFVFLDDAEGAGGSAVADVAGGEP